MPKRSTANSETIPPPLMGINAKDAISNMDQSFALEMENFFPVGNAIEMRRGCSSFATGVGAGKVFDLHSYVEVDGTSHLIATDTAHVYDCTAGGVSTNISGLTLFTGFFTSVNFRNKIFFKSYDQGSDVYDWDGTTWNTTAFVGPSGDDKLLWFVTTYKNRIYFLDFNCSMWYGGVDAVTGALTEWDFKSLFHLGGTPTFIGPLGATASALAEEFIVISTKGEVLLYDGDNPGATNWSLIGRYFIPEPAGPRAFIRNGQDILVITRLGILSLSSIINSTAITQFSFLTDNISPLFRDSINASVALGGAYDQHIVGCIYPNGNYLILNVPTTTSTSTQYVMNLVTGAWAKFTNQNAWCFGLYNSALYFGTNNGKVFLADTGYSDEDPANAGQILTRTVKLRCAFNYFGNRQSVKQFTECRPIVYQSEGLSLTLDCNVDYNDVTATSTVTDTTDTAYKLYLPRMGLKGIGKAASIRIDGTVTTKRMSLQALEVLWNEGDIT